MNDISTTTEADKNGTTVMDWTKNVNEYLLSGLLEDKSYYITVLVKNESGDISVYPPLNHHTVFSLSVKGEGVGLQFKNLLPLKGSFNSIDFSNAWAVGAGKNLPNGIISAKILKEVSIVGGPEKLWALFEDDGIIKGVKLELDNSDQGGLKIRQVAAKYKSLLPADSSEDIMNNWISLNQANQLIPYAMSEGDLSKPGYGVSDIVLYTTRRVN